MRAKSLLLGILLLLIAAGIGWYCFAYTLPMKNAIFGLEGRETPGTIVDMWEERTGRRLGSTITYYADIAYEDEKREKYVVRNTYQFVKWYALKDERSTAVRYLKKDPHHAFEIHSIQGEKPSIVWYLFLCAVFTLPGILFLLTGFSRPVSEALEYTASIPRPHARPKPPRSPLV